MNTRQNAGRESGAIGEGQSGPAGSAGDIVSNVGEAAQEAAREAKRMAASLASETGDQLRSLLDRQVDAGADVAEHVADAVRTAGESLEEAVPQLAGLAKDAADRIEAFSEGMREKSAGELFEAAQDFIRRRPALVFGAAAAAGFLVYRLLGTDSQDGWRHRDEDELDFEVYESGSDFEDDASDADSELAEPHSEARQSEH
jgi:ElaB/YqjD/DUF883 family membrane-anchored ribosome-binding protein